MLSFANVLVMELFHQNRLRKHKFKQIIFTKIGMLFNYFYLVSRALQRSVLNQCIVSKSIVSGFCTRKHQQWNAARFSNMSPCGVIMFPSTLVKLRSKFILFSSYLFHQVRLYDFVSSQIMFKINIYIFTCNII